MKATTAVRKKRALRGKGGGTTALKFRNILVPVDFSAPSLSAVEFALPLIKHFGAHLHLVHAFPKDYPITTLVAMPLVLPELETNKSVHRHLRDVAKKYSIRLPRKNFHVLKGPPFEQICQLARDIDIDLIVIATRGNTGFKHLVLGSTTERVVRYSPCPVLVAREDRKPHNAKFAPRRLSFRRILVPIDFSECSLMGLTYAKTLAKEFGAKLLLLHSVRLKYYVTSDEYARHDFPSLLQQEEKAAEGQMRDLIRQTDWDGIEIESSVQIGHAGDQICVWARELAADLIVTPTHGRTGLKHVLLGSTAEYVVRHAHCPVLVVPSHERPAVKATKTQT